MLRIWVREYTKLEYKVSFATPAFLAGAEQEAEWRTPPFKALLREWWRVVKAPEVSYKVELLREAEHKLFGHAGNAEDSGQSKVRLRLASWRPGTESNLHLKLKGVRLADKFVSYAAVYLGYGPIQNDTSRPAIPNVNDDNTFSVLVPPDKGGDEVRKAMQLAAWFGAVGSRSRNSWGSLSIKGMGLKDTSEISAGLLGNCLRNWKDCLKLDWPHAIGKDDTGPLIWKTDPQADWKQALRDIANLRSTLRGKIPLKDRHILAYPINKFKVDGWGNDARFPNQLRLKIACEQGKYRGILTHVPCALPQRMAAVFPNRDLQTLQHEVWKKTHDFLDDPTKKLTRVK